jgi:predicted TIM-barrel fold metal-dependent hydrolase
MRAISAHEHLAPDPQDIPFLIESGEYEQIWVQCGNPSPEYEDTHVKAKKEYGDFLELFGNLDWTRGPDNLARLKDRGFFGLKAISPPLPYDHDSYFPLYEKAAELRMPVLFHTGVIGSSVQRTARGAPIPPRDDSKLLPERRGKAHPHAGNMRPSMLEPIAATFQHMTIINAHPGFPWLEEAWENLYYYDNVYLDISSGHSFPCLDKWAFWFFGEKCKNPALNFTDKMLFAVDGVIGVDRSAHEWIIRCTRFWKEFFEMVGTGYRWGEDKNKIFIENAKLILKECKG